ncbi:TIGR03620 family F420-dependent LLM class oxidoreductase [Schumannella soli]|uniref:TIGR03620 family F420-dependent LLM class oxidoreductase n=1 Tax=Schumannella soli TaxID=2590779 RepID=UPI001C641E14|nr:TIGR03620 family F420-dependent LLM class oxidoreductase [Schumannella soli]
MSWSERIGEVGVWRGAADVDAALAAEIEGLGFGAIWLGGSPPSDLRAAEALLDATERIVVATGIVNIWKSSAEELAASWQRIEARHPGRLLLGIGSGHREATPERVRPLAAMGAYLDVLDAGGVPVGARVLSAMGPKSLTLAAERSAGTHPYLTVPSQSAEQRAALGAGALIAPEQTVVLDEDAARARETARRFLAGYLNKANYVASMQRAGFTGADTDGAGSDRLVDEIVVHGSTARIATAVRAHLEAGADHVCVQVQPVAEPLETLRAIAGVLGLRG